MGTKRYSHTNISLLPYNQIVASMLFEPLHVGNGAVVPYKQILAPMPSERLNDGNGALLPY